MNPRERRTGKKVKHNLIALGSAAVLTVYAAGYVRTRSAAQRFEVEAAERRPAAPTARIPEPKYAISAQPVDSLARGNPAAVVGLPARKPDLAVPEAPSPVAATPGAADSSPIAIPNAATSGSSNPAPSAPSTSVRAVDSATVPTAAPTPTPTVPPPTDSSTTGGGQASDSTAQSDKERARYKDGVYLGWGTSRHGDIQAQVEIKDGRIVAASISQCLTRYSCSWIAALPPQVVARQSPETDYVSGATQSTNAFYYAVVEALSKAK